jgi:hypothetical protein
MKLFTWIKGLGRRGSNPPCGGGEITRAQWEAMRTTFTEGAVQRGNGNGGPVTPKPPIKPQPTGGRLIYGDRDPGPVPPRLPDDLVDLPVLPAEHLDGAAAAPAPAEMPSDELMERWKSIASHEWLDGGPPVSHRVALLAIAWARQQQAQSLQIPPPGADPVATDEELAYVWIRPCTDDEARRAIYDRGRADERTAILRALGVQP